MELLGESAKKNRPDSNPGPSGHESCTSTNWSTETRGESDSLKPASGDAVTEIGTDIAAQLRRKFWQGGNWRHFDPFVRQILRRDKICDQM